MEVVISHADPPPTQTHQFRSRWNRANAEGVWLETFITWNGSQLLAASVPTGTFSSLSAADAIVGSTPNMDTTGTRDLRFLLGFEANTNATQITYHNFALWPRVLSAGELAFLSQNKRHDLSQASGAYLGNPHLYFRFKDNDPAFGLNLGTGQPFDLSEDANLDASDLVTDVP